MTVGRDSRGFGSAPLGSERGRGGLCPQTVAGGQDDLDSLPSWEREARLPYQSPWKAMLKAYAGTRKRRQLPVASCQLPVSGAHPRASGKAACGKSAGCHAERSEASATVDHGPKSRSFAALRMTTGRLPDF